MLLMEKNAPDQSIAQVIHQSEAKTGIMHMFFTLGYWG